MPGAMGQASAPGIQGALAQGALGKGPQGAMAQAALAQGIQGSKEKDRKEQWRKRL